MSIDDWTREKIKELKGEVNQDWARERRNVYYASEGVKIFAELLGFYKWYLDAERRGISYLIRSGITSYFGYKEKKKRFKRCQRGFLHTLPDKYRKYQKGGITDEMIETARKYPVGELVKVNKRWFAKCFKHDDEHPSLYCKNNFFYCFQCGWKGDGLDLLMERDGLNFADAVRRLQW